MNIFNNSRLEFVCSSNVNPDLSASRLWSSQVYKCPNEHLIFITSSWTHRIIKEQWKWCIVAIKTNMDEENMILDQDMILNHQDFRLKDIDETRIISLKKWIKIRSTKKFVRFYITFGNYLFYFLLSLNVFQFFFLFL